MPAYQNLSGSTYFPDSSYKLIDGFQYKKAATINPKAIKSNTLTPTPLASPLPQAIVPVANKPVGDQLIELRKAVPFQNKAFHESGL